MVSKTTNVKNPKTIIIKITNHRLYESIIIYYMTNIIIRYATYTTLSNKQYYHN